MDKSFKIPPKSPAYLTDAKTVGVKVEPEFFIVTSFIVTIFAKI